MIYFFFLSLLFVYSHFEKYIKMFNNFNNIIYPPQIKKKKEQDQVTKMLQFVVEQKKKEKKNDIVNNENDQEKKNKIDSIYLITTEKEYDNGRLYRFFDRFRFTSPDDFENTTFKIFFNQILSENKIEQLKLLFLKLDLNINFELVFHSLSKENDIYVDNVDKLKGKKIPKYGLSSGPTMHFYETMHHDKKDEIVLLLETDCFFTTKNWLHILNETISQKDFLICGSKYPFAQCFPSDDLFKNHLNGVAIYNKKSSLFFSLLEKTLENIEEIIDNEKHFVNYDMAFSKTIYSLHYESKLFDLEEILNISTNMCSMLTIEQYMQIKPTAVLIHQKF